MPEKHRASRVMSRIREEIVEVLRRDVRDPRVAHVLVTRVEVPDDLQLATIFIRVEIGGDDPKARRAALTGLKSATARIRGSLGARLGLRYTPDLRFAYDESVEATTRVEELLDEIRKDKE